MGETFYSALGVGSEADTESIRRAYRERVKEHHPDVSDAADASEQFKRLTTARDVLVDGDERARYDRLGHERYVRRHVESGVWTADGTPSSDASPSGRTTGGGPSGTGRSAWHGDTDGTDGRTGTRRDRGGAPGRTRRRGGRHVAGTPGDGEWHRAGRTYRRTDTDPEEPESVLRSVVRGTRRVGPWLGVHFVFILSALATGWFAFVQANDAFGLSVPALAFGIVVFGLVIFLSVIHIVAQLYA
jgi:curved DNA-binding protein CbpA